MKKFLQPFLLLFIVAATISSCSNKAIKEAKFIPKDASFVLVAQPASLQEKLEKANIKLDTLYKQLTGKDSIGKLQFEEVKDCGIDWLGNMFVFMNTKPAANNGNNLFISVLANIKDSAKLIAFIKKQDSNHHFEVKAEKEFSYAVMDGKCMLSWTDKYAIVTIMQYTPGFKGNKMGADSISKVQYQPVDENNSNQLLAQVKTFYTQKESESIVSVKPFVAMFKEKADGYMFTSTNSYLNMLNNMPFQLPKLQELLKDNYTTATFNFADGEIQVKSNGYFNQAVAALFKKYSGPTINTSLIENYPSQNINGFMLASFNPSFFSGVLKELEVEALADTYLDKMGFTTADIFKCFKGDVIAVASDANFSDTTTSAAGDKSKKVKMLFNATIGDKASLSKVMAKAVESGFIVKEGDVYKGGELVKMMGMFVQIDDKNFIVASDSLTYVQYMSKPAKANISADVMSKIKGKSSALYVNIASLMAAGKSSTAEINPFKDVIGVSDNFDGDKLHSEFVVRMKDEKQNSLVTLVKMLPEFADVARKNNVTAEDVKSLSFLKFL